MSLDSTLVPECLLEFSNIFKKEEISTLRAQLVSGASFFLDAFALFTLLRLTYLCTTKTPCFSFALLPPQAKCIS